MHYGNIKYFDIANGEGVRTTLFVSGCRNRCEGCYQPETWAFDYGKPFTDEVKEEIFSSLTRGVVRGLTLLGGEPMEPENQRELLPLLRELKERYPDKTVWLYTGNLYEELMGEVGSHPKCIPETAELLSYVDVLVDGRFMAAEYSIGLRFRGSKNQRIIDMNKTRAEGRPVIWAGCSEDRDFSSAGNESSDESKN